MAISMISSTFSSFKLTFLRPSQLQPLTFTFPSSSAMAQPLPLRLAAKIHSLGIGREGAPSDPKAGVSLYKPKSYQVLVNDAANSLAFALQDGKIRLEIDFPYAFSSTFIESQFPNALTFYHLTLNLFSASLSAFWSYDDWLIFLLCNV